MLVVQMQPQAVGDYTRDVPHAERVVGPTAPLVYPAPSWARRRCEALGPGHSLASSIVGNADFVALADRPTNAKTACYDHGSCNAQGSCVCDRSYAGLRCQFNLACPAGYFSNASGLCATCPRKAWCAEGSSVPTPCPAGTVGNATGLTLPTECSDCAQGMWCSAGEAIPCAQGTWSSATRASTIGVCVSCPEHSTTLQLASTELGSCRCEAGRFLQADAEGTCVLCPQPGSRCNAPGITLDSLMLAPGYWRSGNQSREPLLCPSYRGVAGEERCVGGVVGEACAGLLSGVYCASCPPDFYLDGGNGCSRCSTGLTTGSAIRIGVIASVLLLLVLSRLDWTCIPGSSSIRTALARLTARLYALVEASGLAAKLKQLITFYQMAGSVQSVFGVTFPREVRSVLRVFSFLSLNLFELDVPIPTECMSLGSFLQRLLFMLLSPIGLLVCTLPIAWWQLRKAPVAERGPCVLILCALPMGLKVIFVAFPLVSAMAVQAFDCDTFDNGESWLRADYSLRCGSISENGVHMQGTPQHGVIKAVGYACVVLYAIGVPLFFLGLLMSCRKQLTRREPATPLSASLSCLCSEYRKRFFFWEVVESLKKLFFVSLLRLAPVVHSAQGGIEQLLVALMVALALTMCQLSAAPYLRPTDNFLSVLSAVAYCVLLLGAITLKLSSIAEELGDQLSRQLQGKISVSAGPMLIVLLCSTLVSLLFSLAVCLREALFDLRQPKLRFTATSGLVHLPLQPGKTHHIFISHAWGSAQDQARVLRARLRAIAPGLQVWLDVEDLVDISKLEEAVDVMQAVLVIVSSGCE